MQSGLPKPHWPDQVITDSYLPPPGPEPPREKVLAPGAEEVKDILRRWEPFHRGASAADRLGNLYPHIYRVSVVARALGLRKDYTVTLLASAPKEDFLKIIDDGIQVRNRNFVQSIELVTPQIRGSVDYPLTRGNTRECRVTRHFSQKSGRVSFVRGDLPKYKTCIYLSQTV